MLLLILRIISEELLFVRNQNGSSTVHTYDVFFFKLNVHDTVCQK